MMISIGKCFVNIRKLDIVSSCI